MTRYPIPNGREFSSTPQPSAVLLEAVNAFAATVQAYFDAMTDEEREAMEDGYEAGQKRILGLREKPR